MENKTIQMDQTVKEWFSGKYPGIEIKEPKWACLNVAEEYRRMEVGDIVVFPIPQYNYQTIRCAPSTSLIEESMEGKRWTTRIDRNNKGVAVLRVQ